MNNREPLEAAMVGTANFLSKTVMITLKWLGILLVVFVGFLVGVVAGVLKRK